jgi:hypothetical protein
MTESICDHEYWEQDTAAQADGMCPLCLAKNTEQLKNKIKMAASLAIDYGGIDGAHHKMWVIDQMLRVLCGDLYETIITEIKNGEDGPDTYGWDEGIPP